MIRKSNMSAATMKMIIVKAACDEAPSGPRKDESMKHIRAAEKALVARHETECIRALNAANRALN